MTRDGSRRIDPNKTFGGVPIPGTNTNILFTSDPSGLYPEEDITDDSDICSELEQIPLSGVSCNGSAPVYFKYIVSKIGCYECIDRILMPLNISFGRSCYKVDCSKENQYRKEEKPQEVKNLYTPFEPGQTINTIIVEDKDNPFLGWDSNVTYTGIIKYEYIFRQQYDYDYDTIYYGWVWGSYDKTYVVKGEKAISWKGNPELRTEIDSEYNYDYGDGFVKKRVYRKVMLKNAVLILYGYEYESLFYSHNPKFLGDGEHIGSTDYHTGFLNLKLIVFNPPKSPPPPPPTIRTNIDMLIYDCCTCADIRLMLERQKKDIFLYIDEKAIDYRKIVDIVNQLGINITKVNFDLSNQIQNFNQANFLGIATNIGIVNQTLVELTNSIITTSNENSLYIANKIDNLSVSFLYLESVFFKAIDYLKKDLTEIINLTTYEIQVNIGKKIVEFSNKIVLNVAEDITGAVCSLMLFIGIENKKLYLEISTEVTKNISNSVRYAIKVIIEEIRKNRKINATNFYGLAKNIQEYIALLMLQLSSEIKFAVTNIDTTLINNIVGGIGAVITPIINNSFQAHLPDIITNINNSTITIGDKIEKCCDGLINLLNLIIGLLNLKCENNNTGLIISLLNNLFDRITLLENNLGIKIDNLDLDLDLNEITSIINQNSQDIKITIIEEIKKSCQKITSDTCKDLIELVNLFNESVSSQITQLINNQDGINLYLQNLVGQLTEIKNFNNQLINSFNQFKQSSESSFTSIIALINQCCLMIDNAVKNLSEQNINDLQIIEQKIGLPILTVIADILSIIKTIDQLISNQLVKVMYKDVVEIKERVVKIEKLLDVDIQGDLDINCGTNYLKAPYSGKTFLGLSNQLKSITQVLRLISEAICIEISGTITLDCDGSVTEEAYVGVGLKGISNQLAVIGKVESRIIKEVCTDDTSIMPVLYPTEKLDHIPIKTQLQIYFGANYPKATGTLIPIYIPNPKQNLTWTDFENLIRDMGQLYVHIQWDDAPDMNTGLWGISEAHLQEIASKMIGLSESDATLRFTKGGKRKRPIIEKQIRAVRGVISIMDGEGNVIETKCFRPLQ